MRKSTLILAAVAVIVVGFVYWYEFKRTPTEKTRTNPAVFHFQPEDVDSVSFSRPGQTILVDRQGNGWQIIRPIQTRADRSAINALLNDATLAHSSRSLTAAAGQLKTFGLATPSLTLDFKLKNGQQHELKIGNADFTGTSVYAQTGHSTQVLLIPNSVFTDGNKTVEQLRDNSVLGISGADVKSFDLKTRTGTIEAARSGGSGSGWSIEKPRKLRADASAIEQLIDTVSSAKLAKIVSESTGQLARYGLEHPAISLRVHLQSGADRTLDLGRQQGGQFYARDSSRNMVFLVPASLEGQLDRSLFDLRDKKILSSLPDDFTRIDYQAGSLHFSCGVNSAGKWVLFQPAADKGKEAANWKVFNPLSSATAQNVVDSPPVSLLAAVAHPAITINLTRADGGKKTFRISRPVGGNVYVWVNNESGLFVFPKSALDSLVFKSASDILQ
ncbi:MAG TPA: DUF4340 domain-containing protein [Candidatus Dormibacteraeota bacterium]|nr:DUF4340 domain-containing protein [Candidatus Dormibacteraeota bacterium]